VKLRSKPGFFVGHDIRLRLRLRPDRQRSCPTEAEASRQSFIIDQTGRLGGQRR
jgi:hypothetical protein